MKLNRIACQFVDASDSRPIPLVVASSTDNTSIVSDNAGYVVLPVNLPAGTSFHLSIASPGYEISADGFGYRGIRLRVGDSPRTVKLMRRNIAQRSGRITGTGKYIHAQALGKYLDVTEQPLTGMDSVQTASLNGKRYVFYGDTNWTGYPLGNFKTTNGIVHGKRALLPNCPYSITYNTDETGNAKGSVVTKTDTQGVIWISGVVQVGATIVAYANHRKSLQTQLDHGFVQWNIKSRTFDSFTSLPESSWKHLDGHPINFRDNDSSYILFGHAIPNFRVPADVSSIRSSSGFETYTCLKPSGDIERAPDGRQYGAGAEMGPPSMRNVKMNYCVMVS